MPTKSNPLFDLSDLKLAVVLCAAVALTACAPAKTVSTGSGQTTYSTASTDTSSSVIPADPETVISIPVSQPLGSWTVVAGNHLWGIAGEWEVFNLPEKWPLLYKANIDRIDDADLIFPGQVLAIPRDSGLGEIDSAIRHAKTRGAWAIGSVEISDSEYLRSN